MGRLQDFGMKKGYALAYRKGVSCPDCGQRLELSSEMPEGGLKGRVSCGACPWKGSLLETFEFGKMPDSPLDEKPVGSRILERGDRWVIPGTGRFNGEWFFAIPWLGFCIFMLATIPLFEVNGPAWFGVGLLMLFVLVGFWIVYLACRKTFGEVEVKLAGGGMRLTRRLFGMVREEKISLETVTGMNLVYSYDEEEGRSSDLVLEREGEKDFKIDLDLSVDEKRWLLGQWRSKLGLSGVGEVWRGLDPSFVGKAIHVRGVELEPKENGIFFLTVRNRLSPWSIGMGAFMIFVGVIFGFGGIGGWDEGAPSIFRAFEMFFAFVGVIFGLVPFVIGAGALIWGLKTRGEVKKYAFYPDRVEFATVRHGGRIARSGSFPKESVTDVVVSIRGESNGNARYLVQLRATENIALVRFASLDVAKEVEGWVRQWMIAEN